MTFNVGSNKPNGPSRIRLDTRARSPIFHPHPLTIPCVWIDRWYHGTVVQDHPEEYLPAPASGSVISGATGPQNRMENMHSEWVSRNCSILHQDGLRNVVNTKSRTCYFSTSSVQNALRRRKSHPHLRMCLAYCPLSGYCVTSYSK